MSSEIVYDRKFLSTSRGIIPLILSGSSNCTETYYAFNGTRRERLERHWVYFFSDDTIEMTGEELLAYVENFCAKAGDREMFRRGRARAPWVYSSDLVKWYRNGIKSARTLEEYSFANRGISVRCYLSLYQRDESSKMPPVKREMEDRIFHTANLEAWIDAAKVRKQELLNDGYGVYICIKYYDAEALNSVSLPSGPVVVKSSVGVKASYVCAYTASQVSFTQDVCDAVVFDNAAAAMMALGNRFRLTLVSADAALNKKMYRVLITSGSLEGRYLRRSHAGGVQAVFADRAKQFPTKHAAITFAQEALRCCRKDSVNSLAVESMKTGELEVVSAPERNSVEIPQEIRINSQKDPVRRKFWFDAELINGNQDTNAMLISFLEEHALPFQVVNDRIWICLYNGLEWGDCDCEINGSTARFYLKEYH